MTEPMAAGVTFAEMMTLEPHGPDTFVGTGPTYPWGGLFGGQILAQALRAAAETVDPKYLPHSLHAYFIRPGDATQPIRFEVDRIRDGRSFCTRRVVVRQTVGAIFATQASFQVDEPGPDVQVSRLPDVPGPDDCIVDEWSDLFERHWTHPRGEGQPGRVGAWLRAREDLGDDPVLNACVLAFLSDDLPTDAVATLHPAAAEMENYADSYADVFMSASLDHCIWFHRLGRMDRWNFHDFSSHGVLSSRGLSVGDVYTPDGVHLASVTQEVLLRELNR